MARMVDTAAAAADNVVSKGKFRIHGDLRYERSTIKHHQKVWCHEESVAGFSWTPQKVKTESLGQDIKTQKEKLYIGKKEEWK